MNEKLCILIQIWLKFIPKGPIDNKSALVQVMAWRRPGDKPLLEPVLTQFTDAYRGALGGDELIRSSLGQLIMEHGTDLINVNWTT